MKDERKGNRHFNKCLDVRRVCSCSRFNIFTGVIMKKISKEKFENLHIVCECGYHNFKNYVEKYGTCNRCEKVLDEKAKMKYEMYCRLKLWRKNEIRSRNVCKNYK